MLRRTKIVATLGPASDTQKALEALIRAGVDVVRMNFSHGKAEYQPCGHMLPLPLALCWHVPYGLLPCHEKNSCVLRLHLP